MMFFCGLFLRFIVPVCAVLAWPASALAATVPATEAQQADDLFAQARVLLDKQDYVIAENPARAARAIWARLYGEESAETGAADTLIGLLLISQSKFDEGISRTRHGWDIQRRINPADNVDRIEAGLYYGIGLSRSRHVAEAEPLLRQLLDNVAALPSGSGLRAKVPIALGGEYLMQGRLNEAIPMLRSGVDEGVGSKDLLLGEKANALSVLGNALVLNDRPDTGLPFLESAIAMFGEAGSIPAQASAYVVAGTAADRSGDRPGGLQLREKALALLMQMPRKSELGLALNHFKLGQSYAHAGRLAEALAMEQEAAETIARLRPPTHFQTTNSAMALGWIEVLNGGQTEAGLARVKAAFRTSVETNNRLEVSQSQVVGVLDNVEANSQALQAAVLAGDKDFVFEVMQVMVETDSSRAALAVAARAETGNSPLGALLRRRQEAAAAFDAADRALIRAMAAEQSALGGAGNHEALKEGLAMRYGELAALDAELDARFPDFRTLLRPKPVTLGETQAKLAAGEALLVIEESDVGLYTMAITRKGVAIGHDPLRRQALRALVSRVRAGIDGGADADFDTAAAATLYRAIFTSDVTRLIGPKARLRLATGDILSALPLSLLVSKPGRFVTDTRWLIEDHALSVVPSIAAMAVAAPDRRGGGRFIAIGAPALAGQANVQSGPDYFAAGKSRSSRVSELGPLPGAAQEIDQMAHLMAGRGAQQVLLTGAGANEPALRALDLKNVGVLLFATHGLVAGAFDASSEPALVLTPPLIEKDGDDGLLTASEASQLDTDAEWVILSACDTAAGNYPSAAGYTGLARAFLFAGAKRVVASHWPVRDDVAARLSVGIVAASQKGMLPDEALRASILAVMHDRHLPGGNGPAAWAPFMVIAR